MLAGVLFLLRGVGGAKRRQVRVGVVVVEVLELARI